MVVDLQLPPVQSMSKYDGKNKLIFNVHLENNTEIRGQCVSETRSS
jgi:hypothetical protein